VVIALQLRFRDGGGFIRGFNGLTAPRYRQTDAPHRARVNYPRATGSAGGFKDVAGAIDVRGVHRAIIPQPQMITRRDVKTPIAAAHGLLELIGFADV